MFMCVSDLSVHQLFVFARSIEQGHKQREEKLLQDKLHYT